jgi:hypothetical protein
MNVLDNELTTSTWIIVATALVWLGYDIYAYVTKRDITFSDRITWWSKYMPSIAFIAGFLAGHWFA